MSIYACNGFWGILPPKWVSVTPRPQKVSPCAEARHMTYRSLRSAHSFLHSLPFYPCNPPKCYALQWARHFPKSTSFRWGIYTPSNTWFIGCTRLSVPNANGTSIRSAVFAQLTAERPCSLQWAAPFHPNCAVSWVIWTPSNTLFLGPTRILNSNDISIVQPFSQGSLL